MQGCLALLVDSDGRSGVVYNLPLALGGRMHIDGLR